MYYYINDYDYEKHDLIVEEGDKNPKKGEWIDMPELFFYENNRAKLGYAISIINQDTPIVTFYNDVTLHAKDGHKLNVEEITIFMMLLMSETIMESTAYLNKNYEASLSSFPAATAENIMEFVQDRINGLN